MMGLQAEHVRRYYERLAPSYDQRIGILERLFFAEGRRWAAAQAVGRTLEVAIGTGRNLPFYPESVRLTSIDVSPAMLRISRQRAERLGRAVALVVCDMQALSLPTGCFDTVVCTLSLCCVADVGRAVAEMKRVLRPGGRLVLLDHVASDLTAVCIVQRLLEPIWQHFHADSLLHRPLDQVNEQGFEVVCHERSHWGIVERVLARKPA